MTGCHTDKVRYHGLPHITLCCNHRVIKHKNWTALESKVHQSVIWTRTQSTIHVVVLNLAAIELRKNFVLQMLNGLICSSPNAEMTHLTPDWTLLSLTAVFLTAAFLTAVMHCFVFLNFLSRRCSGTRTASHR